MVKDSSLSLYSNLVKYYIRLSAVLFKINSREPKYLTLAIWFQTIRIFFSLSEKNPHLSLKLPASAIKSEFIWWLCEHLYHKHEPQNIFFRFLLQRKRKTEYPWHKKREMVSCLTFLAVGETLGWAWGLLKEKKDRKTKQAEKMTACSL